MTIMKTPPTVKSPRILQFWQWTFNPLRYLDRCSQKYGDCFTGRIGSSDMVFFSHPEAIAEIFSQPQSFDSGRTQVSARFSMGNTASIVIDGEPHRKRRQLLMPLFHGERMRAYGSTIEQIATQFSENWESGQPVEMLEEMKTITLQVILSTVFGVAQGENYDKIKQVLVGFVSNATTAVSYALSSLVSPSAEIKDLPMGKSFLKERQKVDDLLYAEIAERRQAVARNDSYAQSEDILTMLINVRDEEGNALSDEELRDELMTMLLAGHDSSAATLAWAFYYIHTNSAVLEKLRSEIDALGNAADPMDIFKLPYLSAVCSESLRLRSAGPTILGRIAQQPVTIMGYAIPPETLIIPCNYLTHHRAELYPQPRQFRPERFLERQYSPAEFYPFGGSDRRCIGGAFAMFEMKLVLVTILKKYDLTIAQKTPINAVRRGVNIAPQGGVKMTPERRVHVPIPMLIP
jgi:cytochrome P450 family 110